ncbi:tabersonine 16-hydroxylase 1-like [Tripterygium wilfordii]|uniref:tabersonine 16-hydroxylase 1-like n=1 Tax=Tripterygium wilfordii TaxID=458696 RepID=UPI0018F85B7B|nr:tabersonine 16-hydroxylase 1-like [Tripterygium wilfordii]
MELLSVRRVHALRSIREEDVSQFVKSISSNAMSKINLSEMLICLTYEITTKMTCGGSCEKHGAFVPLIREIVEVSSESSLANMFPSIKLFHLISGMRTRLEKLHHEVDKILERLMHEHGVNKSRIGNDLLDILLNLQAQGEFKFPLTADNIKGLVMEVFMGGSETTSTTSEWAMSELLRNSKVMAKAQIEVRHVFDRKGYVDEARLEELEEAKSCDLRESSFDSPLRQIELHFNSPRYLKVTENNKAIGSLFGARLIHVCQA